MADVKVDASGGKVYWVATTSLQRSNLDGSSIETIAVTTASPSALALDPLRQKLYWLENPLGETILMRAGLDGSNPGQLWRVQYQEYFSMVLGPEGIVGVEEESWGKIKQMYRGRAE